MTENFEPLAAYREYAPPEMQSRSTAFAAEMARRRTTRHFSDRAVARSVGATLTLQRCSA